MPGPTDSHKYHRHTDWSQLLVVGLVNMGPNIATKTRQKEEEQEGRMKMVERSADLLH